MGKAARSVLSLDLSRSNTYSCNMRSVTREALPAQLSARLTAPLSWRVGLLLRKP